MLTEEQKNSIISSYTGQAGSTEFNADVVLNIGKEFNTSPNLVRQVLKEAGVYEDVKPFIKPTAGRTNKAAAQQTLIKTIEARGIELDDDEVMLITRLTGKACVFFTRILEK